MVSFWYLFWLLLTITFKISFIVLVEHELLFIVYVRSKSQLLFGMEGNITVVSVVVLENEVVVVYLVCFTSGLFVIQESELRWYHCFLLVSELLCEVLSTFNGCSVLLLRFCKLWQVRWVGALSETDSSLMVGSDFRSSFKIRCKTYCVRTLIFHETPSLGIFQDPYRMIHANCQVVECCGTSKHLAYFYNISLRKFIGNTWKKYF